MITPGDSGLAVFQSLALVTSNYNADLHFAAGYDFLGSMYSCPWHRNPLSGNYRAKSR